MKLAIIVALVGSMLAPAVASADGILTVTQANNSGAMVSKSYTEKQLLALKQVIVRTKNDYVKGMTTFSGPLLRSVFLPRSLHPSDIILMDALNDYKAKMPASDALNYNVILALSMNGKRMTIRDKGPIWVIYPMSQHPELRVPSYNDRLVWQLSKLELVPSKK